MGLAIWFEEDIRNALLAADEANKATAQVAYLSKGIAGEDYFVEVDAFLKGYQAALSTMALAFGLSPATFGLSSELVIPQRETIKVLEQ